jgi:hypothetical protein
MTLADWLLERIAEDEAAVQSVVDRHAPDEASIYLEDPWPEEAVFLSHVTPARVLAECAATRRIVAWHTWSDPGAGYADCPRCDELIPCDHLRALTLPYADHPDFREEWRV